MNKTILLAGALLAGHSAFAAAPPPPPPPPPPGDFISAITAAAVELKAEFGKEEDMARVADLYQDFVFSPATRRKLLTVFGGEHPFVFRSTALQDGAARIDFTLPAHQYQSSPSDSAAWSELNVAVTSEQRGARRRIVARWPSMQGVGAELAGSMRDLRYDAVLSSGPGAMLYGRQHAHVDALLLEARPAAPAGAPAEVPAEAPDEAPDETVPLPLSPLLEGIDLVFDLARRGSRSEVDFRLAIDKITVGAVQAGPLKLVLRLTKLDTATLVQFQRAARGARDGQASPEARLAQFSTLLKGLGPALSQGGARLELDELSLVYRGSKLVLRGGLAFDKLVAADFDEPTRLLRKLAARVDVRMPRALPTLVAQQLLLIVAASPIIAPQTDEQNAAAGELFADALLGQMLAGGTIRLESDELRSTLLLKNGKLTANGKPVVLRQLDELINGPIVAPQELAGKCDWQIAPAPTQSLMLTYDIGRKGRARALRVIRSSGQPRVDAAAMARVRACVWAPAKQGDKPVAFPMVHEFPPMLAAPPAPPSQQ